IAKLQSALDDAQQMLQAAQRAQEAAQRAHEAAEAHAATLRTVSVIAIAVIVVAVLLGLRRRRSGTGWSLPRTGGNPDFEQRMAGWASLRAGSAGHDPLGRDHAVVWAAEEEPNDVVAGHRVCW